MSTYQMAGSDEMIDLLLLSLEFRLQLFLLSFQLFHLLGQNRVWVENCQLFLVLQKLLMIQMKWIWMIRRKHENSIDNDIDQESVKFNVFNDIANSSPHLDDLRSNDGSLELLQTFAVELLLDFGPFSLLALAISLLGFLVETVLFDFVGLAALLFHRFLLFSLASSVFRLQHLLAVFDDLTTLKDL